MAIDHKNILEIDLDTGNIFRTFANKTIGEGDGRGNRFGVRAFRNKQEESLEGCTVTGYFIRSDGQTIIISGTASGNVAYVILPPTCYAVEGMFSLAIKVTGGSVTGTMCIVDGTVVNTTTDSVIDPGGTVPDITALMAVIERAEDAAAAIEDFSVSVELNSGTDYTLVIVSE